MLPVDYKSLESAMVLNNLQPRLLILDNENQETKTPRRYCKDNFCLTQACLEVESKIG